MLTWLAMLALAQGSASGERIARPALPGFIIGFSGKQGAQSIVEQVPAGESVQGWTRMVTSQKFVDMLSGGVTAEMLATRVADSWMKACPGAQRGTLTTSHAGGYPEAEIRVDCPRNPQTGKPETMFLRAVTGASDGYSVQVAFRRVPSAADVGWATDYLAATHLCGPRAAVPACRAGT